MKTKNIKKALCVSMMFMVNYFGFSQSNGLQGIDVATRTIGSYFGPLVQLIYAIGAILGLIGGIKVFNKFNSGDPDTSKTAAAWFGSCIFLVVVATVLRSFFF